MINFFNLDKNESAHSFTIAPGSLVGFRITVHNNHSYPIVLQPKLDDWIRNNGSIIKSNANILPQYQYLPPNSNLRITITFSLPSGLNAGDKLFGSLGFPGVESDRVKINLTVASSATIDQQIREFDFAVQLPLTPINEPHQNGAFQQSKATLKLLSGMAGLEVLPAKWLVSELVITICEKGAALSATIKGKELLSRLTRTSFYKNGVLVFRASQVPHWILMGISISSSLNAIISSKTKEPRILHTWEEWLFKMINTDLESSDYKEIDVKFHQEHSFETIIQKLGTSPENWFSFFILGLTTISPRMEAIVQQICEKVPETKASVQKQTPKKTKKVLQEKGSLQR
jgi:hypothetical protein